VGVFNNYRWQNLNGAELNCLKEPSERAALLLEGMSWKYFKSHNSSFIHLAALEGVAFKAK